MKILFIGCVESSYLLLEALLAANQEVVGVITKENSRLNADFADLTPLCEKYKVPCCYVNNVNEEKSLQFIQKVKPEIGFCFGWSQLLAQETLNSFPKGVLGFHPAALPYNKGRHPIIWALVLGLSRTASSFFEMNLGADTGAIVSQVPIPIAYEDDARSLYDKIMEQAVKQELHLVKAYETNTVQKVFQTGEGNSWRKRSKADGRIDFRMSSLAIYNLVRGLTRPYVGAHIEYEGREYKVWKVKELKMSGAENLEPGLVLSVNEDGTIDVKAYDHVIRLIEFEKIPVQKGSYL